MSEIWKDIVDYEGLYQVSNLGRVKSFKWNKDKILKGGIDLTGYYLVVLHKNRLRKTKRIHQLVSVAFLNHIPNGYELVVDHINDDKIDNRVENLQLVTQRENAYKKQGNYSSQYKGVCWHKQTKKWVAHITINGKLKHLGLFINEKDASNAYKNKLKNI